MACSASPGGMVLFDPKFLESGSCRKVYVLKNRTRQPWTTEAHVHPSPQLCSLLMGEATLAYQEPTGAIRKLQLKSGLYYRISPNVAHQFQVWGPAVFESFDSSSALLNWLASGGDTRVKRVIHPDLFTQFANHEIGIGLGNPASTSR